MRLAPRYKQNNTKSSSKGMYYYYKDRIIREIPYSKKKLKKENDSNKY